MHKIGNYVLRRLGVFDRSYRIGIAGAVFTIPIVNGRKMKPSETWMIEVLRRLFAAKNGAFIDVGVNLGQTLVKVAALDPARDYLGFEPNPTCVDYVETLIRVNGLRHRIIPAGLGSAASVASLVLHRDETDPSASVVPDFRRRDHAFTRSVVIVGFEDIPAQLLPQSVGIVKIDVEGAELEVVEGMLAFFARQRPIILVEILPVYSSDNAERLSRQHAIERHMAALRYRKFRLRGKDAARPTLEPIETIDIVSELALADYLMVPDEDAERIAALF